MSVECMFKEDYSIDIASLTPVVIYLPSTVPSQGFELVESRAEWMPSVPVASECNPGKNGQTLMARADSSAVNLSNYITLDNGKKALLFPTTYPGLYYTLQIISMSCPQDINGHIPPSKEEVSLVDAGDSDKACMDNAAWKFSVDFYIGTHFRGALPGTAFHSDVKAHGKFRISGTDGDTGARIVTIHLVKAEGTF